MASIDPQTKSELEDAFKNISTRDNDKSQVRRCLTEDVFNEIKDRTTPSGATLLDVIRSSLHNADSSVGMYAPDAASYEVFAPLFGPVIQGIHKVSADGKQPDTDFGDPSSLSLGENKYIVSTRIRCARSLSAYPLNSKLSESQYSEIEGHLRAALETLTGDLAGTYYPLRELSPSTKEQLINDHVLYKEDDRFLKAANASRFWPTGRGIFYNKDRTIIVWVNEEDHVRIISLQQGADLASVYSNWIKVTQALSDRMEFSRDSKYGYLTFCPSNIGTGIRASVHIKLPKLEKKKKLLDEIAAKHKLQVRGTRGEHSDVDGSVFDISNETRLGATEYDIIKGMQNGLLEIIKAEEEGM